MLCLHCCHAYPMDQEVHLPINHNDRSNVFKTLGHFCSYSCAKAYALDTYGLSKGGIYCTYLTLMKKQIVGKITFTKRAPSKLSLIAFGGSLTIEQFRSMSHENVKVHTPTHLHVVHTVEILPKKSVYERPPPVVEQLVLRRTKPTAKQLASSTNSLSFLIKTK